MKTTQAISKVFLKPVLLFLLDKILLSFIASQYSTTTCQQVALYVILNVC